MQHQVPLILSGISKTFVLPSGEHISALKSVDLTLNKGEIVALVGESGSGKSTLARALLGLTPVDCGEVRLFGADITHLPPRSRPLTPSIQPVFQDSSAAFNPRRKIGEALAQADRLNRSASGDPRERMLSLLNQVGLTPAASFLMRYPHELSGGQRQRLAIARALAASPDIIIADEPLSGADVSIRGQVLNLLLDLREQRDISILFVTHDILVAKSFADKVVVLFKGEVVEIGLACDVLNNPQHEYTKKLVAAVPTVDF